MQELLLALAQGLVEDKAAVRVTEDEPNEEGVIVYHLTVAEDDMGRDRQAGPHCKGHSRCDARRSRAREQKGHGGDRRLNFPMPQPMKMAVANFPVSGRLRQPFFLFVCACAAALRVYPFWA